MLLLPVLVCLLDFVELASIKRGKRQVQTVYICGSGMGQYISNYPCQNWGCSNGGCSNGCNNGNCQYSSLVLPNSFYNSYSNCDSGCGNVNCNNFYGQYINGQYVAYSPLNNVYSPCASTCCNRQQYLPLNGYSNMPPIGQGAFPFGARWNGNSMVPIGQGAVPINLPLGTINNHACINGQCPTGYRCQDGRCVNLFTAPLLQCSADQKCHDGFKCGEGNLCYPIIHLTK